MLHASCEESIGEKYSFQTGQIQMTKDREVTESTSITIPASGTVNPVVTTTGKGRERFVSPREDGSVPVKSEPKKLKRSDFVKLRDSFSLEKHGDARERLFCQNGVNKFFPSYELMWKILIVPATKRIESGEIDFRNHIAQRVITMCQFHYSIMRSLLLAHSHLNSKEDGSFEAFIMHLENALEQADLFLLFWAINSLRPRPKPLRKVDIKKDETMRRAIRNELLGTIYGGPAWKSFRDARDRNQYIRDSLLHGPFPLLIRHKGIDFYPTINNLLRNEVLKHPQYWRNHFNEQGDIDLNGFKPQEEIKAEHFESTVSKLNILWKRLLPEFESAFFTSQVLGFYRLSIAEN